MKSIEPSRDGEIIYYPCRAVLKSGEVFDAGYIVAEKLCVKHFGRTPKINPAGGRDHYPECWSALVAGGPIAGGQVIGSSDATGSEPRDHPFTPADIAATVERFLT